MTGTIPQITLPSDQTVPALGQGTWYMGRTPESVTMRSKRFGTASILA